MKTELGYAPHTYQHTQILDKSMRFLSLYSLRVTPTNEDMAGQLCEQMTGKVISSQFYR